MPGFFAAALRRKLNAHVRAGGVIAYPTASCFGLGCDPKNLQAVRRLLRIKRRMGSKGVILIASRVSQLQPYLQKLTAEEWARVSSTWPGPHTWVMPAAQGVPHWITGGRRTLAVRLDAHPDAVRVCEVLNLAVVSTSANLSGKRSVKTYRDCLRQFGRRVLVVSGRIGRDRRPSTIHDLRSGKVLR